MGVTGVARVLHDDAGDPVIPGEHLRDAGESEDAGAACLSAPGLELDGPGGVDRSIGGRVECPENEVGVQPRPQFGDAFRADEFGGYTPGPGETETSFQLGQLGVRGGDLQSADPVHEWCAVELQPVELVQGALGQQAHHPGGIGLEDEAGCV